MMSPDSTISSLVTTSLRSRGPQALALLLAASILTAMSFAMSSAGAARATARPVLNDAPWPAFEVPWDGPWAAYTSATGTNKALLAKIALRPRVEWFTSGTQNGDATAKIRKVIQGFQHGNPDAYAQIAIFGMYPKGESHRSDPIPATQVATYKHWIDQIAAGISDSKVIMVLEPDLAVAWGGWKPGVRFAMARYAARELGALPNTKVYLDGSDADWLKLGKADQMVRLAGIQYVDGIALGATHYSSTSGNIRFGAALVRRLAAEGIGGKTVVIDTADNAKPFTPAEFWKRFPHGDIGNANLCKTKAESKCVTLGIPPTTQVALTRWHLSATDRQLATRYVDAYLWFGRPWLYQQASPFQLNRALAVARTTPF
jgi:endoglucanase